MNKETPPIKPMSPEDWEVNKSCELKKRDHKFIWDANRPGTAWAQCVHCGQYRELFNKWNAELNEGIDRA